MKRNRHGPAFGAGQLCRMGRAWRVALAATLSFCPPITAASPSQSGHQSSEAPGGGVEAKGHIDVGDARLGYVSQGEGADCLVVGSSVYYPRTFPKHLDLRLHFVDMRWFAPEPGSLGPKELTIERIVQDIEQARRALGLSRPILMGHSIHGAVAMEYARRYPEHVEALVTIGTPCLLGSSEYERIVGAAWESASLERRDLQERNWRQQSQRDEFSPSERIVEDYCVMAPKYWFDQTYDGRWLWEGVMIHAQFMHRLYGELFSGYRMFESGDKSPVPTLAIVGRFDYIVPPELWAAFEEVPQLEIVVLEESGHTPQLEQEDRFVSVLIDWLNRKEKENR